MKWLNYLIILCLVGCSGSFSSLTKTDCQYLAAATLLSMVDHRQTIEIKNTTSVHETNVILGKYPSDETINNYFAAAIAGEWFVAWALPTEARIFNYKYNPRRIFQIGVIGIEAGVVSNNYQLGIKIEF